MKNENVLRIALDKLNASFDMSKESWPCTENEIDALPYGYEARPVAEQDFTHKQVIPYALVFNASGELLHYQRCGSEKRLAGIFSAGIGGHLNDADLGETLFGKIRNGLRREMQEEIGIALADGQMQLVGMINEDRSEVGRCHIGVVFKCVLSDGQLNFESEIGHPQWRKPEELDLSKFELWSALAIGLAQKSN